MNLKHIKSIQFFCYLLPVRSADLRRFRYAIPNNHTQPETINSMHYLLIYELAPDYLERRGNFRDEHLHLAWHAQKHEGLILGGALKDPADKAVLLFQGETPQAAEAFAKKDPYVKNGIVREWTVRPWHTVVGDNPFQVVKPAE